MVNIITTRNFRSLHSLKKGLMMGSHVKTTADRHYTASEYSTGDILRTLGY